MASGVFSIPLDAHAAASRLKVTHRVQPVLPLRQFITDADSSLVRVAALECLSRHWDYRPVVFVGPSGTGKSSLALEMADRWKTTYADTKTIVTTGADFARDFAEAVETDAVADFRTLYRTVDLLVIDDLHQMIDKRAAQIELIHTLDLLLKRQHRQVLLTMQRMPLESKPILPALISRISGGLIVPLDAPGPTARREILQLLLDRHQIELSNDAFSTLTDGLTGTVPELTGAVVELAASNATLKTIEPDTVQRFLAAKQLKQPTLRTVTHCVARHFGQTMSDVKGPTRRQAVVRARSVAMFLSRQLTGASLERIGAFFGGRDHTTVLHACRKVKSLVKSDDRIRQTITELQKSLEKTSTT